MGALDEQVAKLQGVVDGLEARIKRLEERKFGDSSLSPQDVRMILIGPPGAGAPLALSSSCAQDKIS